MEISGFYYKKVRIEFGDDKKIYIEVTKRKWFLH